MYCEAFIGLEEVYCGLAFTGAVVIACENADPQDVAELLGAEGSEGLEGYGKIGTELQAGVEDAGGAVHVFLRNLPGLHVGDVFIADAGDIHRLFQGLAEVEGLDVLFEGFLARLDRCKRFCVNCFRLQVGRHGPAEVLVREHDGTVYEVAQDGYQLAVVAALEVLPGEVVVFGFRGVGGEHVAEHILLPWEVPFVFVHPYGPAAGSGNLVAFQVQEFVGGDVVGKDIVSISLKHGREYDAVEHNIVLADKMHKPGVRALPPLLPALRQKFLGIGNIADGSVKPNVEHFALRSFYGDGDAPVEVTRYCTGLQATVQPAFALAVHVGFPFLVAFQYPFPEPGLVLVKRKIPVFGLAFHRSGTAEFGLGIQQLFRRQRGAAFFALVTVGMRVAALGACALYEPVGEEHAGLFVIELFAFLGDEIGLVIELAEELGRIFGMDCRRGAGIDVEVDAQGCEGVLHYAVVLVHNVLRGDTLLPRLDGDGDSVLVGAADKQYVLPAHAQISDIDVSGNVSAGQVADMDRTVGVRERTGHKGSFVTHLGSLPSFILIVFFNSLSLLSCFISSRPSSADACARLRLISC